MIVKHPASKESGSATSYVVGFLLSLALTAIPYYIVVNKAVSGSALPATILGFALLQMLIQIFFFLHLGRGPKPLYNVIFFGFTVVTILVVVVGSIWIMNHLNYNMAPIDTTKQLVEKEGIYQIDGQQTGACHGLNEDHKVIISNGRVTPLHIEASHCDTLTFVNEDDKPREITFGTHPQHGAYGGENELTVRKGRAQSVVLNETGAYQFHDHLEPDVAGTFTVSP